jgi:hypothetical protein
MGTTGNFFREAGNLSAVTPAIWAHNSVLQSQRCAKRARSASHRYRPAVMLSAGSELAGQIQLERVGTAAPAMGVLVAGVLIGEAGVAQGKPRAGRRSDGTRA